ncbi:MAG: Sec-independent protein translocase subunit TatA [Nocardioidaceae bacterium]
MVAGIGPPEILLILLVLVLLFGAKKLPELARGSGRALRIFKAETKGLMDDDAESGVDEKHKTPEQKEIEAARRAETEPGEATARPTHPETER